MCEWKLKLKFNGTIWASDLSNLTFHGTYNGGLQPYLYGSLYANTTSKKIQVKYLFLICMQWFYCEYIFLVDQIKENLSDTQIFSCLVTIYENIYLKWYDAWIEIEIEIWCIFFTQKKMFLDIQQFDVHLHKCILQSSQFKFELTCVWFHHFIYISFWTLHVPHQCDIYDTSLPL